ncbi:MAG TPA: TolC family protein [Chthoniobacteraceae bacterium]|jgi:cobalt-zinc-cadmium efflux system outer membrane protein|nr:TolC family protein [Chthoniobacteraceae bacterium]
MRTKNHLIALALGIALTASGPAKENAFAPVEKNVRARTKSEVRWSQDMAAQEQALAQARALLRRPLTVSGAVQVALLNNRELQAGFEEVGLSFADVREARLLANPSADLAVKFPDRPPTAPMYEWGIAQNFLNLLMIPLRSRVARDQLAAAQLRVSDQVVKLVAEVKVAFYQLQGDEALLARLRTMQEGQAASLQLTQKLHEAGNVPDLSLSREQAVYSQGRLEIARAEAEGRAHREKLNRLLGTWGADTSWRLAGELPHVPETEPSLRGLETLAVANRFDLAAARVGLESTVRALGLEKTFRFIGALDFGLAGETDPDKTNLLGPSLRLELPVFNQGQARIARGEAQLRMAHRKFEGLAIEIRSDVRELRDRLISQRDLARFYRDEVLPTRRRITEQTLAQYNAMLVGAFETFQARKEDVEAERGMIEATRDYWITRAELERAVGGDLEATPRAGSAAVAENKTLIKSKTRKP